MTELLPIAPPSAVAILETPRYYLAEGRPDRPGALAYSGKIQLFGGHRDEGEPPEATIAREIWEELGLQSIIFRLLQREMVDSQLRDGTPAQRDVSLFHGWVPTDEGLVMWVPGSIIRIGKTLEGVAQYQDRLTPFAHDSLVKFVKGEFATKQ